MLLLVEINEFIYSLEFEVLIESLLGSGEVHTCHIKQILEKALLGLPSSSITSCPKPP